MDTITFHIDEKDRDVLKEIASFIGISLSGYVRSSMLEKVREYKRQQEEALN